MAVKTIEKPDVFHIGYSKAASTWLQEYLRLHDEIFLLFKSNFFLKDVYTENSISDYQKLFPVSSSYKLTIESDEHIVLPIVEPQLKISATNYDSVKERALKIHKLMPHIKIILIIRNQTDIILSRYIQYIKGGGSISFSKFSPFNVFTS